MKVLLSCAHRAEEPGRDPGAFCVNGQWEADWSRVVTQTCAHILQSNGIPTIVYVKPPPLGLSSSLGRAITELNATRDDILLAVEMHLDSVALKPGQKEPDRATVLYNGYPLAATAAERVGECLKIVRKNAGFSDKLNYGGPDTYKKLTARPKLGWIDSTKFPAILTESGFGVNRRFAEWAFSKDGCAMIASAHATGIMEALRERDGRA